jgi:uncharacterized protein (DUF58 family)
VTARAWVSGQLARSSATLARALGRGGKDPAPVTLDRNRVFIVPTGYGVTFGAVLMLMLLGSLNYNNNMGLALTFLLGGMTLVSILHTYRNLAGLSLRPGRVEGVFAGEVAVFHICLVNPDAYARDSLVVRSRGGGEAVCELSGGETRCPGLAVPSDRRGVLALGSFRVETRFPLGLFRAWSNLDLDMSCLVYPRLGPRRPFPHSRRGGAEEGRRVGSGVDDFAGLRAYRPGDSTRRIHWKALARQPDPHTKLFTAQRGGELWLDWEEFPELDKEARLSRFCRWIVDAEAEGSSYGLRLPGKVIDPDRGAGHRRACLEALAVL